MGFLTGHANQRYMLHKMGRVKSPSCGEYGAEKETSVHILYEFLALERVRRRTLDRNGIEPDQKKRIETEWRGIPGRGILYDPLG